VPAHRSTKTDADKHDTPHSHFNWQWTNQSCSRP